MSTSADAAQHPGPERRSRRRRPGWRPACARPRRRRRCSRTRRRAGGAWRCGAGRRPTRRGPGAARRGSVSMRLEADDRAQGLVRVSSTGRTSAAASRRRCGPRIASSDGGSGAVGAGLDERRCRGRWPRPARRRPGSPAASAVSWHSSCVLRAAADDVDHVDAGAGQLGRPVRRCGRRPAASESRMQRTVSAGVSAGRAGRAPRSVRACRPGGMNAGSSTSMSGPPAGSAAASARSVVEVVARRQARSALLEQPQAADVAQEPGAAVDAALVGEVGGPGLVGEHRAGELEPDERPGAAGDVGEPLGAWRARATTAEAVSCEPTVGDRARPAAVAARRGPSPGGSTGGSRSAGMPSRSRSSADQSPVRTSSRPVVDALVQLGAELAGEPVGEEVGQQHGVGGVGPTAGPAARRRAGRGC